MIGESSCPIATVLRNKRTAQQFWTRVFNDGDLDYIDQTLAPGDTYNGSPGGADGLKAWVKALRSAMPDLFFRVESLLGAHDTVAIRWTLSGTRDGKEVFLTGENVLVFDDDGRAVSNWQFLGTPDLTHQAC
ncbi:MAG: hypothetical protein DWQ30_06885 [Acidobacteria bacterium]|nr:MAG: hypothetical protein DWQ30_06885 [Acidobacteriota bacterium]